MSKDFDFDTIGKRTPYRVPEHFFEDMRQKIEARAGIGQPKKRRRRVMRIIVTTAAVAALLSGWLFVPSFLPADYPAADTKTLMPEADLASTDPLDKWIRNLSDEELEELVRFSENDIFFN